MFSPPPWRCRPPGWARSGHAQTVLGHVLPAGAPHFEDRPREYEAARVPLRDGDSLFAWHRAGETGLVVSLFHGLGGSTRAGYVRRAAAVAAGLGHTVLAVNHRGCGPGRGLARRPYMAGRSEDLSDVLDWARARHPEALQVAVGFSLSGNTLLRLAGLGEGTLPDAALCINPEIDLDCASRRLLRWPARGYDLFLLRACRRWVGELRGPGPDPPRYRVPALSSLREFDASYITPVWGFASREEYYRSASSRGLLASIRIPTAVLAAADDPIADPHVLRDTPRSRAVHLHVEPHGGHLGFLSDRPTPLGTRRWLDYALAHYLRSAGRAAAATSPTLDPHRLTPCARP